MEMLYKIFGKEDPRSFELQKENEYLKKSLDIQLGVNKKFAEDTLKMEEKLNLLMHDAEQYIEIEVERRMMELEDQYKDQMNHKWYSLGRTDAYAEMGIRALNSRKAGTTMYYLKDTGEVIEDITNTLEEVPLEFTDGKGNDIAVEIEIGDLQDA